jgi:hypothetical protein
MPWIAITTAQVTTEVAIITNSGIAVDFADFAMASHTLDGGRRGIVSKNVFASCPARVFDEQVANVNGFHAD